MTDRISPDGTYILGTDADAVAGIALDGRVLWEVPRVRAVRSAITADGKKVVLFSSKDANLAIYDTPSGNLSPIGSTGQHPAWSPAGDRLAYDDGSNVHVHDPATNTTVEAGPGTEPSWLSDGASVAVRAGSRIDVIHLADGTRTKLFADARGRSVPRWSPDGHWMMYTRRGGRYWWSIDWTGSGAYADCAARHAYRSRGVHRGDSQGECR
jgi:Tol biopolymer transport system component